MKPLRLLVYCLVSVASAAEPVTVSGYVDRPALDNCSDPYQLIISGRSPADRVFINVRRDSVHLDEGDSISIWKQVANRSAAGNTSRPMDCIADDAVVGQAIVFCSANVSDMDIRSDGPALRIQFAGSRNSSFALPYRILTVGHFEDSSLCGNSSGCSFDRASGTLMFPYVPISATFTHTISSDTNDTVYLHLNPDAIGLYYEDVLTITNDQNCSEGEVVLRISRQEPLEKTKTVASHGSGFCVIYNGTSEASYFYISYRKISKKVIYVRGFNDIAQEYQRSSIMVWILESARNVAGSLTLFVIRRLELDESQGEFLMIGPGNSSQIFKSSPPVLITTSLRPGGKLTLQLGGLNAYVVLYMGNRNMTTTKTTVLYMDWEQKAPTSVGLPTPETPLHMQTVWQEAMLLCAEVNVSDTASWDFFKQLIREKYAHAANDYLKEQTYSPDWTIGPHQVMLPEENPVLSHNRWGTRVSLLLTVSRPHEADTAYFKHAELEAIYDRMANEAGRTKISGPQDGQDFWLSKHCREPSPSFWWFLYSAFCLGLSLIVFTLLWRWRAGSSPPRSNSKKVLKNKNKEKGQQLEMPETFHVNPAFIPDEDGAPGFRPTSLQHFYDDTERHIEIQKDESQTTDWRGTGQLFPRENLTRGEIGGGVRRIPKIHVQPP